MSLTLDLSIHNKQTASPQNDQNDEQTVDDYFLLNFCHTNRVIHRVSFDTLLSSFGGVLDPYISVVSDDRSLFRICSGVLWCRVLWSSSCVHFMSRPQKDQSLCICSVLYVLYYVSGLYSGGFDVYDCSHVLVQCVLGARH